MPCPLVTSEQQPWRTRKALFSPASLIGGVVLAAFGTLALVSIRPWVGWAVFGVIGLITTGVAVLQWRHGHRGWCLVRRALWFGLALPGAPLRLLGSAPYNLARHPAADAPVESHDVSFTVTRRRRLVTQGILRNALAAAGVV